jgi:hypothetical protein
MLMTRPGLLYRDQVNIFYVSDKAETLANEVWTKRTGVLEFLKRQVPQTPPNQNGLIQPGPSNST